MKILDLSNLNDAIETALTNFTGETPDDDTVDLVADRVADALDSYKKGGKRNVFLTVIESSSTYVLSDLSENELLNYVDEIEYQLEEAGLL